MQQHSISCRDKEANVKFDTTVTDIIEKGLEGNGLSQQEAAALYGVAEDSAEGALLRWAGQKLSLEATGGIAEIHAQIGLNATPCPKNCLFCSFAACNKLRHGRYEVPLQDVLDYARIYEEDGANAIILMCTASYSFEKLTEMVQAVREAIDPAMPLLTNTFDLTLEQAQTLRALGINGAYHAVRMGEGVDTEIPVQERLDTLQNLRTAGLKISTCVEPIGPEHTPEELAEATFRCIDSGAITAGCGRRINVAGAPICARGMLSSVGIATMVAVYRLIAGRGLRLNCSASSRIVMASGANLAWAECGTNPRDALALRTENGGRGDSVQQCRKMFIDAGWEVRKEPSPGWVE